MSDSLESIGQSAERAEERLRGAAEAAVQFSRSVDGIRSAAGSAQTDLDGMSKGFQQFSQGTLATIDRVREGWEKVATAIKSTFEAAASGQRHEAALQRLGAAYYYVESATRGAVSAEQALRTQQSLSTAGLELTSQELATVTRAARDYAVATGTDTSQALDQLTDALRTGEAQGLAKFGARLEATGSSADNARAAISSLETTQRGAAPAAQTLSEQQDLLGRRIDEAKNKIALAIVSTSEFPAALEAVSSAIPAVAEGLSSIVGVATSVASAIAGVVVSMAGFAKAGQSLMGLTPTAPAATGINRHRAFAMPALADGLLSVGGSTWGVNQLGFGTGLDAATTTAAGALARRGGHGGGGGGGGPRYDEAIWRETEFRLVELSNKIRGTGIAVDHLVRDQGERLDAFIARQTAAVVDAVGGDATHVLRHRGETLEAFVGRELAAVQERYQERLTTARSVDEAIQREHEEALERERAYVEGLSKINEQVERLMQRRETFDRIVNNPDGQLAEYEADLRAKLEIGELSVEQIELQLRAVRTEALAESTTDREADALQRKAEALARVRDEMREHSRAQGEFLTDSEKAAKTIAIFSEGVEGTVSKTFGVLQGALSETIGALLDGQEVTAEVLRKTVHQATKQIALMALAEGTLELGKGLGKLATSYGIDVTAYGHFAAAGVDLGLAAAFGLASYATRDMTAAIPGGATQRPPQSVSDRGSSGAPSSESAVYNFNFASATYGTTEELQDSVLRGLDASARRGIVPAHARTPAWVG